MRFILVLSLIVTGCGGGGGGGGGSSSGTTGGGTTTLQAPYHSVYFIEGSTLKRSDVKNNAVVRNQDIAGSVGSAITVREFSLASNKYSVIKEARYIVYNTQAPRTIKYYDASSGAVTTVSSETDCSKIVAVIDTNQNENGSAQGPSKIYVIYLAGSGSYTLKVVRLDQISSSGPATIQGGLTTTSVNVRSLLFSTVMFYQSDEGPRQIYRVDLSAFSASANITPALMSASADSLKDISTEQDLVIFDDNSIAYIKIDPSDVAPPELTKAVLSGVSVATSTLHSGSLSTDNLDVWGMLNSQVVFTVKTSSNLQLYKVPFAGGGATLIDSFTVFIVSLNSVQFTQNNVIWAISYLTSSFVSDSTIRYYNIDNPLPTDIIPTSQELKDEVKPELIKAIDGFHLAVREKDSSSNVYIVVYKEDGTNRRSYFYVSSLGTSQIYSICPKSSYVWDPTLKVLLPDDTLRVAFKENKNIVSRDFNLTVASEINIGADPSGISSIQSGKFSNLYGATIGKNNTLEDVIFFQGDISNSIVRVTTNGTTKVILGVNFIGS